MCLPCGSGDTNDNFSRAVVNRCIEKQTNKHTKANTCLQNYFVFNGNATNTHFCDRSWRKSVIIIIAIVVVFVELMSLKIRPIIAIIAFICWIFATIRRSCLLPVLRCNYELKPSSTLGVIYWAMELFSRRRWATGSAQQSNNFGIMSRMCCINFSGLT